MNAQWQMPNEYGRLSKQEVKDVRRKYPFGDDALP
jgi:hypothetical protein